MNGEYQHALQDWLDSLELERIRLKEQVAYLQGIIKSMKAHDFIQQNAINRYRDLVGKQYDNKYNKP